MQRHVKGRIIGEQEERDAVTLGTSFLLRSTSYFKCMYMDKHYNGFAYLASWKRQDEPSQRLVDRVI